jgi:hypothetical protein
MNINQHTSTFLLSDSSSCQPYSHAISGTIAFRDVIWIMYSWRCDEMNLGQTSTISTHFSLLVFNSQIFLFPCCLRYNCCHTDENRHEQSTQHPCDSACPNCLVKKPKSVAKLGVCPDILITHWLGNRGQHLLWRHLRGMLLSLSSTEKRRRIWDVMAVYKKCHQECFTQPSVAVLGADISYRAHYEFQHIFGSSAGPSANNDTEEVNARYQRIVPPFPPY